MSRCGGENMSEFIMAINCPECGELAKQDGKTVDFTAPNGVVCLDLFSQQAFHCENCGVSIYTGDIDDCIEWE